MSAFSPNEPLRVLAHNLDYWLPFADEVARRRLAAFGRAEYRSARAHDLALELKVEHPDLEFEPPMYHSEAWAGEQEAWAVSREVVDLADSKGRLRGIIDAIHSNRVVDDFSSRWSYAKEDFERKLYSKRSKCKVTFVELDELPAVHGPAVEYDAGLVWDDLMTVVDQQHRNVVVLLRAGVDRVGDMADILGYANHSPVSKKLKKIRDKARRLLFS